MTFRTLPFVETTAEGHLVSWWSPKQTDDYDTACQTGADYCHQLLDLIGDDDVKSVYLVRALEGIVRRGQWTGVEIGFASELAKRVS